VNEIYDFTKPRKKWHCRDYSDGQHPHYEWICQQVRQGLWDAKKRAKAKKVPFEIEEDDLIRQVTKNKLRCALSAIPFRPCEEFYRNPYRPSIDRINSKGGYTKGNVRIVAYCVNAAMNEWGVDVLVEMAKGMNGAWRFEKPVLRREPSHICSSCGYEFLPVGKRSSQCRWCEIEWETKRKRHWEQCRWGSLASDAEYLMKRISNALGEPAPSDI
jgi:predicted Zn-ribbon and HTH transcriptional regulator